jgi:dTMP kinase
LDRCIRRCRKRITIKPSFKYLFEKNIENLIVREPGGTKEAEKIREFILGKEFSPTPFTELLQLMSARNELYSKVVDRSLKNGIWVLSDRCAFTSEAYQCYGRGMDLDFIRYLNNKATLGYKPDLFFFIDVPVKKGLEKESIKNRMSLEKIEFYERARKGFLEILERDPIKYIKINYQEGKVDEMQKEMRSYLENLF